MIVADHTFVLIFLTWVSFCLYQAIAGTLSLLDARRLRKRRLQ